jgi:hypothetical protein
MQRNRAFIAALLSGASTALAADLSPEGKYDFTSCYSGVTTPIQFSKTHSAFTFEMTGTTLASQPGAMFDKVSYRCIGLNTTLDGKTTAVTICEAVDKDGDKSLSRYDNTGGKGVRIQLAGTGKYEGSVVTGSAEPLGPFPTIKPGTFQNCTHQMGTYKLPKLMK